MNRVVRHRLALGWYIFWVLLAIGVAFLAVRVIELGQENDAEARDAQQRDTQIASLVSRYNDLYEQIQGLGAEPVAPPPEEAIDDPPEIITIPGPRGPAGAIGPRGPIGPIGPVGLTGAAGAPGATGPAGEDGADGSNGAAGEPGAPGEDGAQGPPGEPGATGSQGVPGPPGANGEPGPPGQDGADGQDGQDGVDGQPPASWTFTWMGTPFTCEPTDPFDPAAPTYECEPEI